MLHEEARRVMPHDGTVEPGREQDRTLVMARSQFDKLSFDDNRCLTARISRR